MAGNSLDYKWYVIATSSGYEKRVKETLEKKIANLGLQDKITDVFVPITQYEVTDSKGNVKIKEEKVIPNYVFVRMVMTDETWHVVFNTENTLNFVGADNKPEPIADAEVEALGAQVHVESTGISVGDHVKVQSGPMQGFEGTVVTISEDQKTITVNVNVFGRETPVEIEVSALQKI
jgi:transcriptional antiterminator NusG